MPQTVFTKVDYTLRALIESIDIGDIGLPEIQRPFVWKNTQVRNLFDSMYRGFPVGNLLFWQNAGFEDSRPIGNEEKQKTPQQLIVDGQQRLTSLYAVIKGAEVVRKNYQKEKIEIAFNPILEKFEVADAAIRRDPSYIPDISDLWRPETDMFSVVADYLERLKLKHEITPDQQKAIQSAISRVDKLMDFPFTSLTLSPHISEEQVSEVFVRINSEGKKLNQADFILTLMSVFWDEGRAQLESFCRSAREPSKGTPSPYNHFIDPEPDQLLRASIGLGFRRGRLKSVYSVLRGRDLEADRFDPTKREQQFATLKAAQAKVLNVNHWHDFLKTIRQAGYRSGRMISSQNSLMYTYTVYLIGKTQYDVDRKSLERLSAQWFFMTALTGRYTSSPESRVEQDLALFRDVNDGKEFVEIIENICSNTLTPDYWSIALPTDLATSSATSPSLFAYYAALNILGAKALFSDHNVKDLMDPTINAKRSALERHHLFPKAFLKNQGITDAKQTNQIANFTMVEWGDNASISDSPPSEYVPQLSSRFTNHELERMHYWHALPTGWESLDYPDFLVQRREAMAAIIRDAYKLLTGLESLAPNDRKPATSVLNSMDEGKETEFKSTLRTNLHTGQKDPKMEFAILKTLAAFVNSGGGKLFVGVSDDGSPVGIEADGFPNEDKMNLHLVNLINSRLGGKHAMHIYPHFDDYQDARVLIVECTPGRSPVFLKDGSHEKFFVRNGAATSELTGEQMQTYIRDRFNL